MFAASRWNRCFRGAMLQPDSDKKTRLKSGKNASSCPEPSRISSPTLLIPLILPSQSSVTPAALTERTESPSGCRLRLHSAPF